MNFLEVVWQTFLWLPWGTLLVVASVLVALILVYAACSGLFFLLDTVGRPEIEQDVKITKTQFTPVSPTIRYFSNAATNSMSPYPSYVPEKHEVVVELEGYPCSIKVDAEWRTYVGMQCRAVYVIGRFSGRPHLRAITPLGG